MAWYSHLQVLMAVVPMSKGFLVMLMFFVASEKWAYLNSMIYDTTGFAACTIVVSQTCGVTSGGFTPCGIIATSPDTGGTDLPLLKLKVLGCIWWRSCILVVMAHVTLVCCHIWDWYGRHHCHVYRLGSNWLDLPQASHTVLPQAYRQVLEGLPQFCWGWW